MKTLLQVSLLIAATIVTASVSAQRAEPAVKPESEASVEEKRPLATEHTQPPVLIIELPPPQPPEEEDLDPDTSSRTPPRLGSTVPFLNSGGAILPPTLQTALSK